jgi:hypothetical protein
MTAEVVEPQWVAEGHTHVSAAVRLIEILPFVVGGVETHGRNRVRAGKLAAGRRAA